MTRRDFVHLGSATLALSPLAVALPASATTKMGLAATSYLTAWRPRDAFEFLEHSHALGAAGIQAPLNGDLEKIRARAAEWGMYVEGMVPLPKNGAIAEFERRILDAKSAGASCVRAGALNGRRYETFSSLAAWREFVEDSQASIDAAVPVLEKHKMPLALENHKDWTVDELVAIVKKHSSEYLGVCLDFGNNISLLDDPMYVAEKLAPFAVATHLKDMAVAAQPDGFLLSEVPLGQGFLDLPRMISLVRQARPATHLSLEMITRDPLQVPCLLDKYWVSFPDRDGVYLARTLRLVQQKNSPVPLPRISQLSHAAQLHAEEDNVKACFQYERDRLHV